MIFYFIASLLLAAPCMSDASPTAIELKVINRFPLFVVSQGHWLGVYQALGSPILNLL